MQDIQAKAKNIKLVIFDVDGVLTDGSLIFGDDGQEYKSFNSKDGHGMVILQRTGIIIGIITGRTSNVVNFRMKNLGITHVYQGKLDKLPAYEELKKELGFTDEQIAYVGDDMVDLPIMSRAGLAIAVNDATDCCKEQAHWVTNLPGGKGAAREVCHLIMSAQGTLESTIAYYLK